MMNRLLQWKSYIAILLLFCIVFAATASAEDTHTDQGWVDPVIEATAFLDEDFHAVEGFSSHLPLVVLERNGTANLFYSDGTDTFYSVSASPSTRGKWAVQQELNAFAEREKLNYHLTFAEGGYEELASILWDRPVTSQWQLLGSMHDKSLLRNYLALTLAAELYDDVYRVQYCEVLVHDNADYLYQGVYLLVAPPADGYQRVQRDLFSTVVDPQVHGQEVSTYAGRQGFLPPLYVPLTDTVTVDITQLEGGISEAESAVYSSDYNQFSKYERYFNMERTTDYYLLYELFGNYMGAMLGTYAYDANTNTFWPAFYSNFEYALDNVPWDPFDFQQVMMTERPYYPQLVQSSIFVQDLVDRYKALAKGILDSTKLEDRIDETVDYLGAAQTRDWQRWNSAYAGTKMYYLRPDEGAEDGAVVLDRNTYTYEQEIVKLKFLLRRHGEYIVAGISELFTQEDMVGEDAYYVRNTLMAVIFFILAIASVVFVRRRYINR